MSLGRPLDAEDRKERVRSALAEVRAKGADHLVISGDLTEDGAPAQFEVLAEVLAESRISPDRITLVPGNHDAYTDGQAYARALEGPLRPYAPTSECGTALRFRDMTIVPISTAFHQSVLRSAGAISPDELAAVQQIASDPELARRPLVFVQHHPPGRHLLPLVHWIDGLVEHGAMTTLFERCPHLHVIHGHTHHHTNRSHRKGETPRVFSAKAVVECDTALRLYEAYPDGLSPLEVDRAEGVGAFALSA